MCIRDRGLTVNWEKSKFLQQEIHFLGFIISLDGIRANPAKVEAIMRFPEPKNIKQLQSFLGLCNFYRKFQKNYAQVTSKLSAVLQKNKQWRWGEAERVTFNEIKEKFMSMIMMKHPDFQQKFYLQTDASNIALGAELYQEGEDKEHRTIASVSYTHLDVYKRQVKERKTTYSVMLTSKRKDNCTNKRYEIKYLIT